MPMCTLSRSLALSGLFIKEQLKEPVALFWMIISPVVTYYLLAYSRGGGFCLRSWLHGKYILVLCIYFFKCRFFWIFFLHRREEGERLYQIVCLHARRKDGIYGGAVFSVLTGCLDLQHHFLCSDLFFLRVL